MLNKDMPRKAKLAMDRQC